MREQRDEKKIRRKGETIEIDPAFEIRLIDDKITF